METPFKKKFMRVPHMPMAHAFREMGRNAFVDWILILIVSLVVGGVLVAGGVHLYWQITSGNFKSADSPAVTDKVFNKDDLTSITDSYKLREDESAQVRKGYRGPADPSL